MSRLLLKSGSNFVAVLEPVPLSKYSLFFTLYNEIISFKTVLSPSFFLRDILAAKIGCSGLIQRLVAFIPDSNFLLPLEGLTVEQFFLILEGVASLSQIEQAESKSTDSGDGFSLPSTGDWEADLLADLIHAFGIEGALRLRDEFDANTVLRVCDRTSLLKNPEAIERLRKDHDQVQAKQKLNKMMANPAFANQLNALLN